MRLSYSDRSSLCATDLLKPPSNGPRQARAAGAMLGRGDETCGEKKIVHHALARSDNNAIVLDPNQLAGLIKAKNLDPYEIDGGGYELGPNEVAVDLFCGAGGTSQGILEALGEGPAFAVNHNPYAIGVHAVNHPDTIHLESDVFAADPAEYMPDTQKSIGLLALSPSCTHFSSASGGAPKDAGIRDHAWIACHWAEHPDKRFRPRVIILENVREFLSWCPLTSKGKVDKRFIDKNGLGSTFKEWHARLANAGYAIEYRILNAADFGVPTKRKRLFVVARRDGLPIRFPKPTHGPRNSPAVLRGDLLPWVSAASVIDFGIKCNPIFMYPEDAKAAGAQRPLAENTLKRIAAGVERFVIDADDPFIVSYYGPKDTAGFRGQTLHEPLATQTTENRFSIVNPMLSPITHTGPGRYYPLRDASVPTLTTANRGELAVISPICFGSTGAIIPMRRETDPVELRSPIPALTSKSQMALAIGELRPHPANNNEPKGLVTTHLVPPVFGAPFLTGAGGSEYAGKPRSAAVPMNTIKCDSRAAVVMPTLVRVAHGSVDRFGKRRGRGDHDIQEPLPVQSTSNEFALVTPFLVTTGYGERAGQAPRVHSALDPAATMVAQGAKHAVILASLKADPAAEQASFIVNNNTNRLATSARESMPAMTTGNQQIVTQVALQSREIVAAHLAQQNEGNVGHSMHEPISTMTTKVCHQNVVTSHMLTLRQNGFGQALEEPMPAFCAAGSHMGEVRTVLVKYYSDGGGQHQDVKEPLDTLTQKARFSVVQVPVEELGLTEEQRFEAYWVARFLEVYGSRPAGNPATAHLDGPRPSAVGRPGAILWTVLMRMLALKEAAKASSFPDSYELSRTASGQEIGKGRGLALVGNAVPPGLARAIIGANVKPRLPAATELPRAA